MSGLVSGKWYVCNINPPKGSIQGIGVSGGKNSFDHVLGGPFDSRSDAERWLEAHPECQGPYAKVLQFAGR